MKILSTNRLRYRLAWIVVCLVNLQPASAQGGSVMESEPNDTPAIANPVSGAATLIGDMVSGDQDAYRWTVSDTDAAKRWDFTLHGIPGQLTIVEIIRVNYAENGSGVAAADKLYSFGSRDGFKPVRKSGLILEPGDYILGLATAGGGNAAFRPPAASISFNDEAEKEVGSEPAGYRLVITEAEKLFPSRQRASRLVQANAFKLRLNQETTDFTGDANNWYHLQFNENAMTSLWTIHVQTVLGRSITASLHRSDGSELASAQSGPDGKLQFTDLTADAGDYWINVSMEENEGVFTLIQPHASGVKTANSEAEPNDQWPLANRIELAESFTGSLSKNGDTDYYQLSLSEQETDALINLTLENSSANKCQLCLLDDQGARVQCRESIGTLELKDLVLTPGIWGLSVSRGTAQTEYTLSMSAGGAILPDTEAEPNDSLATASTIPNKLRVKGTFNGNETDHFRLVITDEPQLWRFQVMGDNVAEVIYMNTKGTQLQRVRPGGARRARMENVFLLPGIHRLSVRGGPEGSYTLIARPLGPPSPDVEREPNNDTGNMQPIIFGQTRTGQLTEKDDRDNYRFHLANWDRIRLTITPPADGGIGTNLYWGGSNFKQVAGPAREAPFEIEGLFPPGDYHFSMTPSKPSDGDYSLKLERLPRFGCPSDCEPNDTVGMASPLPPDFVMTGHLDDWREKDIYSIPVLPIDAEWTFTPETSLRYNIIDEAEKAVDFDLDKATGIQRGVVPANSRYYVQYLSSAADSYRVTASSPQVEPAVRGAGIEVAISLDNKTLSSYREVGQQTTGTITLRNPHAQAKTVRLAMATSDVKYSAIPELTAATISANAELAIPFVLKAGKDLWPDVPVRISVHAETMQKRKPSAQNEAFVELTPSRDAPPQSPSYFPDIPKALHGGINVARTAFGAELVGEYTGAIGNGFENLFDDINVRGLGFTLRGGVAEPYQDIVIRLAGDQPSEIIGTAINLFNKEGSLTDLSHLSMAVSVDGATFTPVLDEPLLPVKVEQYFVLDEPVKARYARLRLQHTFSGSTKQPVSLAEWKVIANGDHDMTAGSGQNLADPTLGGHVVYAKPLVSTHWDKILLTDEKGLIRKRLKPAQQQEMVIGFHHNRAARIARVEWVREEEPRPPEFSAAQVSISLDSPHGPWTVLGALPFENGGKVVTLSPSAAVWARFVKITLPGPESQTTFTYPEQIRIIEQPAGPGYQSILGEWGDASSLATYEETLGPPEYPVPSRATHTSREKARPLTSSQSESGAVSLGNEEHWYRLNLPAGHNKLTLDVSGDPTVRVVVSLLDEAGEEVLLKRQNQRGSADQHIYEAVLQPGSNYYLKVEEPPRNVVFTWDTSASVAPYLPMVYNALVAFADDVVPGRDSVNLVPFGSHLLLDDWQGEPYLLKTILNDYLRNESSSEAEGSMKSSTEALQPIPGTKAIVVMTDNTTNRTAPMWDRFAEVRPRVFGIGVGGGYSANEEQDRFQDWAYVNGGHYKHSNYLADIDVAFDRAATMMRRPAAYQILASSEFVEAPGPGQLSIVAAESGVHFSGGVELILDASGSMLKRLDGERRIAIAKAVLTETVRERLPAGTPTALRVFGHKEPNACRTDLEIPLGPLDPEKAASIIAGIQARNLAKTPIADSLAAIANDMKGTSGKKLVVLVTDGEETCDGNPAEVLEKLASQGIDVSLNIVGFAIDDRELEAQFTDWAELGGGRYYAATDQSALSSALESALKVSYRVYSNAGEQVAEGKLGDQPVMLDQGRYRVVVETGPPITFDSVEIIGEQTTTLSVD